MTQYSLRDKPIIVTIGHEEIMIRRRYEFAGIANDFLIALWFLIGSVMFMYPLFMYPLLEVPGVWLFIIGSFQMLIRPTIRLAGHIHLKCIPASRWDS
jgi:hypothetical protein